MWWPLELRRVRSAVGEEGYRRAFYECCRCVAMCLYAREGKTTLLEVDRKVHALGRVLTRFGESEARKGGITRQKQLFEHAVKVRSALDERAGLALKDGDSALPDLVSSLMKVLERLGEGRLLSLLDESSLPPYDPPSTQELEEETRRADGRIVIWGASAAALAAAVMISVGVPVGAVVPAALIFLMGPATIWGSKKIGNPKDMLDAVRQGVSQPSEPQQASGATEAVPPGSAASPTRRNP